MTQPKTPGSSPVGGPSSCPLKGKSLERKHKGRFFYHQALENKWHRFCVLRTGVWGLTWKSYLPLHPLFILPHFPSSSSTSLSPSLQRWKSLWLIQLPCSLVGRSLSVHKGCSELCQSSLHHLRGWLHTVHIHMDGRWGLCPSCQPITLSLTCELLPAIKSERWGGNNVLGCWPMYLTWFSTNLNQAVSWLKNLF